MPPNLNKTIDNSELTEKDENGQAMPEQSMTQSSQSSRMVSPATDLQYQIETAYDTSKQSDDKWSPRQTFIFLVLVCGSFWGLAGFLVFHIF